MEKALGDPKQVSQFGALRGYQVAALEAAAQISYELGSAKGVPASLVYLEEGLTITRDLVTVDTRAHQKLLHWASSAWYNFGALLFKDELYEVTEPTL